MSQRPGPATGMPTWTEQGDLLFTVNSGHGEFPKIVLAPGDINEMIDLTLKAFNLADIYQKPVIVMSDKLLSESHESVSKDGVLKMAAEYTVDRGKLVKETQQEPYLRYKITDDGISERLIPGQKGKFYQSNSYEHHENSHTSELAEDRQAQVDKRNRKTITYFNNHYQPPAVFGNLDEAQHVFVSWGGNKGVIREAQRILEAEGIKTAYVHFIYVFPLHEEKIRPFFRDDKHYVLIENNSHSQFGKLLRAETGITIKDQMNKYDGRPFLSEEIVSYIKEGK
jgi:2-oxoglutarate ferredoxin oxidoreductase subunit alpha